MTPSPRPRWPLAAAALLGCAAVYAIAAWYHGVPGGWTLRGWVVPHALREARAQAARSAARLATFARENPAAPEGAVLFLGSSTIEYFPLDELFAGVPCLNRGIGNESAAELLARLEASLPQRPPAGAVLYAASIDFRRLGAAPEEVAARAWAVVRALRERYPDLPVALVGLLSERDFPPGEVARLARTNAALAELASRRELAFVRTDRPPVTLPDGTLAPDASADRLHLNERGYRALAGWIVEDGGAVGRLLGP